MCGILGIANIVGRSSSLSDQAVCRLRDLMEHRGPDGAGMWRRRNIALAHRRLAVIDPTPAGAQPMLTAPDPDTGESRFALVYNGELYNDGELRTELGARGVKFRSQCDAETVLQALATWGLQALPKLRGMFALAFYDSRLETITLARDPMGVKPLYYWRDSRQIVFASETRPILAHPDVHAAPNPRMVSAYLTTIRTVLANETLFLGVHSVRPGEVVQCDLSGSQIVMKALPWWKSRRTGELDLDMQGAAGAVRSAVEDSILRQLRSDVPMCTLLSGGLDSTVIAAIAKSRIPELRSFCAGSPLPFDCAQNNACDLNCARTVSEALGTRHAEAHVTREVFAERWPRMIQRMGLPLSTPNEVAIHAVALRLREDGCVVTLSGEGADELFAGYEGPLDAAAEFAARASNERTPGSFELNSHAWTPIDFKPGVLSESAWEACEQDRWLMETYDREFSAAAEECGSGGVEAHLRLHRRINLSGLLQRLDSATMLASVEGRTPFADGEIARLAESLPMALKYRASGESSSNGDGPAVGSGAGVATLPRMQTRSRTKMALREAFVGAIPQLALERSKASFPLPFQQWVGDHAEALRRSSFAREIFTGPAIEAVASQPQKLWHLAWPMTNIAIWGESMGW